ncbi:MAG: glycosyltransferase family 39 protein [Phycisphaeraceae bacterium]
MKNYRLCLLLILAVALVLRLAWMIAVPVDPVSDSFAYMTFATHISQGHGMTWEPGMDRPTAYWPVGAAALYALSYMVLGSEHLGPLVLNLMASMGCVWLTGELARHLYDSRTALTAAAIMAFMPSQIYFTTIYASEIFFNLAVLAAVLLWIHQGTQHAVLWGAIWTGTLLAVAAYIRPTALLIPFLLTGLRLLETRRWGRPTTELAVMITIMIVFIAPWSYRNHVAFDSFVPISTNGGANLWMGNNPSNPGGGYMPLSEDLKSFRNEAERDRRAKEIALKYIKDEPIEFVFRFGRKLRATHERDTIGVVWNEPGLVGAYGSWALTPLKFASTVYWYGLMTVGATGAVMMLRSGGRGISLLLPGTLIVYFTFVHAVIVAQDRYHYAAIPYLALFGAVTLTSILWTGLVNEHPPDRGGATESLQP